MDKQLNKTITLTDKEFEVVKRINQLSGLNTNEIVRSALVAYESICLERNPSVRFILDVLDYFSKRFGDLTLAIDQLCQGNTKMTQTLRKLLTKISNLK